MVSEPDTDENIQATYNHYRGRSFEPLDFGIEGHMFDVADVFHELCIFYVQLPFKYCKNCKCWNYGTISYTLANFDGNSEVLSEEGCDFVNYLGWKSENKRGNGVPTLSSAGWPAFNCFQHLPPFNCSQAWLSSGVGIMPNFDTRVDKLGSNVQHWAPWLFWY